MKNLIQLLKKVIPVAFIKLFSRKSTWLLFLVFFVCFNNVLYAQNIISRLPAHYPDGEVPGIPFPCADPKILTDLACIIYLQPAEEGTVYSFQIPLINEPDRSNLTFIFIPSGGCSSGSIECSENGTITMPTTICISDNGENYIDFDIQVIHNISANTDQQRYRIPILRKPVKVVLVLDISGSMGWTIPGGTDVRWNVLKKSVDEFTKQFEIFQQKNDSIGLTYFTTYTIQPGLPIDDGFILIPPTTSSELASDTIKYDMGTRNPLYATAMGLGLLNAKLKLNGNNTIGASKLVLLFTDGLQNVNPMVNDVSGVVLSDGQMLNQGPCDAIDSIRYYTIGMGAAGLVPTVLANIALASGAEDLQTTTGDAADFQWFFDNQFADMLSSGSPQIVSRQVGLINNSESIHTFNLNGNLNKVLFKLSHHTGDEMNLILKKDGIDLTSLCQKVKTDYYTMLSLDFPVQNDSIIYSEGEWTLKVTGNSESHHYVTVFADDHFFDFNCNLNKDIYTVGDTIQISTALSYAGNPLTNENTIKAILFKPGEDLGNLLATYDTPENRQQFLQDSTEDVQQKFLNLINNDTSFYNQLLAEEQIITLEHQGNGVYTGFYKNTELTGIYQLLFQINGEIPSRGKIVREKLKSIIFQFGQVEPETPELVDNSSVSNTPFQDTTGTTQPDTTTISDQDKRNKLTILKIRPKNIFGYYMGPGYKSKINVVINPGKKKLHSASLLPVQPASSEPFVTEIRDNLDGSYYIFIAGIAARTNPVIQIKIRDELLYQGKVCPVPVWVYILLIILLILLILLRYYKSKNVRIYKIILWIFTLLILLLVLLQYYGILKIFC